MLNQLLKITLWASLWLWLKPRWRGLLALVSFVVVVHIAHSEYLGFVELSGERAFLAWSYVVKWVALIFAVLLYLGFSLRSPAQSGTAQVRTKGRLSGDKNTGEDDGFDFLRGKAELRSEADLVIDRKTSQDTGPGCR